MSELIEDPDFIITIGATRKPDHIAHQCDVRVDLKKTIDITSIEILGVLAVVQHMYLSGKNEYHDDPDGVLPLPEITE